MAWVDLRIEWTNGTRVRPCPVCGRDDDQELVARVDVDWQDEPVEIVRCRECRSILLSDIIHSAQYDARGWDWYVEQVAALDAIADMLATANKPAGARSMDVGCGFGFGVDLAAQLFGWQAIGLDPSEPARRGRTELGIDIRSGTFEAVEPDEQFDVIFASEVLEHIAEPRGFLRDVRQHLTEDGVLILSTPDGGPITKETPTPTLYPALSVGLHHFLVDERGLERLLRDAGYEALVWHVGASLHAAAARSAAPLREVVPRARVDLAKLIAYTERRGTSAPTGSALALGMNARAFKWMIGTADFERAKEIVPRLRESFAARYGVDLDDPAALRTRAGEVPTVLAIVFCDLGLLELWHRQDPRRAAEYFAAAAWVAKTTYDVHDLYPDPETPAFEAIALGHLAVSLGQTSPDAVAGAITELAACVERSGADPAVVDHFRARAEAEARIRRSPWRRAGRAARRTAGRARRRVRGYSRSTLE